jgi:hypothetical protein
MYNYTTLKMQIIHIGNAQKCQISDIFIQVFQKYVEEIKYKFQKTTFPESENSRLVHNTTC